MKTTLNKIRSHGPCGLKPAADGKRTGLCKLMHHLGKTTTDDDEIDLLIILESNGLDDALWCLRAVDGFDREKRLYAVWCARQVEHLNPDPRVKACNDMAERYANGLCTVQDLQDARRAAYAAASYAADAAAAAAAADAADADAAYAAAYAADAAAAAAYARKKSRAAQEAEFRRMLQEGYP